MELVQQYTLTGLMIYVVVLAIIVYFSSRRESADEFLIGGRRIGIWGTVASLAAGFRDGAGIAAWITLAVFFGFGALWLTAGMALALLLLAWLAPRVRAVAKDRNYITMGDYFKDSFGDTVAFVASLIIAVGALLISAVQIFVSGTIFSLLLGISSTAMIVLVALIVAAYLLIGGYKTVIKTDIFQWGIIMLLVLVPFFFGESVISDISQNAFLSPGLNNIVGFAVISFLVTFSGADVWQRIFSSKSATSAKTSFLLTVPIYFLISIGLVVFGLEMKPFVGTATDPFFAIFNAQLSPVLISLFGLFIAISVMSTMDTQIFLASTTITEGLFAKKSNKVYLSRLVMLASLVILSILAIKVGNLVEFLFGAYTSITILFPLFLLVGYTKKDRVLDLILSGIVIISFVLYIILFAGGYFENIIWTVVPALVSLGLSLLAFCLFKIRHKFLISANGN